MYCFEFNWIWIEYIKWISLDKCNFSKIWLTCSEWVKKRNIHSKWSYIHNSRVMSYLGVWGIIWKSKKQEAVLFNIPITISNDLLHNWIQDAHIKILLRKKTETFFLNERNDYFRARRVYRKKIHRLCWMKSFLSGAFMRKGKKLPTHNF